MKTIYICEVCHCKYDDAMTAILCETQPVFPAPPPIGTIVGYGEERMVFAVMECVKEQHYVSLFTHACRDTGPNQTPRDNPWGERCGLMNYELKPERTKFRTITEWHKSLPCFGRILSVLREHDIAPMIWNGLEAVPL